MWKLSPQFEAMDEGFYRTMAGLNKMVNGGEDIEDIKEIQERGSAG